MAQFTNLDFVKKAAGITSTADDSYITDLITGVSGYMAKRVHAEYSGLSFTEKSDGVGTDVIRISRPASGVSEVLENGQAVDSGSFELDAASARLVYRIGPDGSGEEWARGRRNLSVTYTEQNQVPSDLGEAATLLCAFVWKQWGATTGSGRLGLGAQANTDTGSADYFAQAIRSLPFVAEVLSQGRWY